MKNHHYFNHIFLSGFVLLLLLGGGCHGGKVKVSGRVTYDDGKPVTKGEVRFLTDAEQAYGAIDQDGNYTIEKTGQGRGLPPGEYSVAVISSEGGPGGPTYLVHPKYMQPNTSGLKFTVPNPGGYDIKVEYPQDATNKKRRSKEQ